MAGPHLAVRVLRMSRSFPEPADVMAAYRLHRGVDIRDVADAHVQALSNAGDDFQRYIISAATPFSADDCDILARDAASILRQRTPPSPPLSRRWDGRCRRPLTGSIHPHAPQRGWAGHPASVSRK